MQTILYQGRPSESDKWLAIPFGIVATYKDMGYQTREWVLRDDAERAKVEHFNEAIEKAVQLVEREFRAVASHAMVNRLRALKLKPSGA